MIVYNMQGKEIDKFGIYTWNATKYCLSNIFELDFGLSSQDCQIIVVLARCLQWHDKGQWKIKCVDCWNI